MKILVINGPNLNLLGTREPSTYGNTTLSDVENRLKSLAVELSNTHSQPLVLEFVQSNIEGELVSVIQSTLHSDVAGILINPGAYGHTSIAMRDAFLAVAVPFVEVHVSNIYARESFRHHSYLTDIAKGIVAGFGANSYELGLKALFEALL